MLITGKFSSIIKISIIQNKLRNFMRLNTMNYLFGKMTMGGSYKFYSSLGLSLFGIYGVNKISKQNVENAECWGIIGYVGKTKNSEIIILEGIDFLKYRGYDSAGIWTINEEGKFIIDKKASTEGGDCIKKLFEEAKGKHNGYIGIGHTRWATHGGKTDINSHPHLDLSKTLWICHNGMVENYLEIKTKLEQQGIHPISETDTELIVLNVKFLKDTELLSTEDAFRKWMSEIEGSNCVLLLDKEQPDKIFAYKNAGSLMIGIFDDGFIVSSQAKAFQEYAKSYQNIENDQVYVISPTEIQCKGGSGSDEIKVLKHSKINKNPNHPFRTFYEEEVFSQSETAEQTLKFGGRIPDELHVKLGGLDSMHDELIEIDNLIISAMGTSLYAGMFGEGLMMQFWCFDSVRAIESTSITENYFRAKNQALLAISQSGETIDVKQTITLAQDKGKLAFAIVNEVESVIARQTKLGVFLNCGHETSVASTKAFTSQCLWMGLLTAWFAQNKFPDLFVEERKKLIRNLQDFSSWVQEIFDNTVESIKNLASKLHNKSYMAILGKGLWYPIALESALKIKEITYMPAEGYSSGKNYYNYSTVDNFWRFLSYQNFKNCAKNFV